MYRDTPMMMILFMERYKHKHISKLILFAFTLITTCVSISYVGIYYYTSIIYLLLHNVDSILLETWRNLYNEGIRSASLSAHAQVCVDIVVMPGNWLSN